MQNKPDKINPQYVLNELIKNNNILNQNCIELHKEIKKCSLDINSLYYQNSFLKHENDDLRSTLHMIAIKIGMEEEFLEDHSHGSSTRKKVMKQNKVLPLHDDLTLKCPACSSVVNKNFKTCSKCGYSKNK